MAKRRTRWRATDVHPHHHAVQFYGNDHSLFSTVAGFLGQALIEGAPAILIATDAHRAGICEQLDGRLIDVPRARRRGDLVVLDADETLARFMTGDMPDADRFETSISSIIRQSLAGRPSPVLVRAYGEMVDVLWKRGRSDAAIRLEMFWNKLVQTHGFALLCGYAMGSFFKQTRRFEEVCRQHTHVVPPGAESVGAASKRAVH